MRSWNIKSYESFDPTDSFGQDTRVYINKNQVIKIEPEFSSKTMSSWLTDKGRLFFDSFFINNQEQMSLAGKSSKNLDSILKSIFHTFYVYNTCNFKYATRFFFVLVFVIETVFWLGDDGDLKLCSSEAVIGEFCSVINKWIIKPKNHETPDQKLVEKNEVTLGFAVI